MRTPVKIALMLLISAGLGMAIDRRVTASGGWLPPIPEKFAHWTSQPVDEDVTVPTGSKYVSRYYVNSFGETVKIFVLAAESVEVFNDPKGCMRGVAFEVTGERPLEFADGQKGRLLALRKDGERFIMAYWLQFKDGGVSNGGPLYRDIPGRGQAILGTFGIAMSARPTCICRVFSPLEANDANGVVTRANVVEIAEMVRTSLKGKAVAEGR